MTGVDGVPTPKRTRGYNIRLTEEQLDRLRREARAAGLSLHAHIIWLLFGEKEAKTLDPWEELRRLAGHVDIEDVSEDLRRIDRTA